MGKVLTRQKSGQKKLEVSLIIPAHNSAAVIKSSIVSYSRFLSSSFGQYELIVVCNACIDNTEQLSRKEAQKNEHIRVVSIKERGKGLAILKGFRLAKCNIIGFMDADCVFNLDRIKGMISQLRDYDCVIASKWLGQNVFKISEPFTRKLLAVFWKAITIFLFHMRFHDTQAGAKFLRKHAFDSIDKNFVCTGFDFDVELLYKLKKKGFRIKECYIPLVKTAPFSTFRLKFIPGMFFRLFKLWSKTF